MSVVPGSWVTTASPNTITPLTVNTNQSVFATNQGGPFGSTTQPRNFTTSVELQENEAFNTDVQTLSDLWLAKWGNEWVDVTEVHDDRFWSIAYERLRQLGMIEQHYLTDRATNMCRRPK